MNIATLTIEMAANVARLRQDMDNAASVVQSATAKMQKAAELAGKALGLLGVGLSVSAFTGFLRNAIDAADALDEMSGRIGVSAKELSGLQLAYRQAGMGNEAMASSLAKLSREMSEGNAGLRALGVNTRNADGSLRGTTAVLLDVADKFTTLEDGAAKTALAVEIFGKSGTEMVPLLNSGSEGIAQMTAMAEKLGLVIEDEAAAQAGQFNDTLELLGLGVQGVGSRIAAQLLPTLTNLTGSFLESMTSGDRLKSVADFLAASLKILYTVGVGIVEVFSTVGKTLGAAMGQVVAILKGNFSEAAQIGREWKTDVTAGWSATSAAIKAAWSEESNAAVTSAATQVKVGKDLLAEQKAREEQAKKSAAAAAKAAEEAAKKAADGAKLAASLLAQDSGLQGDFAEKWDKLNAAYADNKISLEDLTQAQKKLLEQQPLMKKALDDAAKASQSAADARKAEADGIAAWMQAQQQAAAQTLAGVNSRVRSLLEEERAAKLARDSNISLAEAVELVAIARLQEEQAGLHEEGTRYKEIEREIAARRELVQVLGQQNIRQREEQGWSDMWASVDRTAHDVFVNVFEGGSNVFKKLGQTLKASVLDVLYQMTVRKWIINIGTSIFGGGFGAAASAATGGGAGGMGSNLLSGASLLGRIGGGFGMGLNAGFSSLLGEAGLMGALDAGGIALGAGNVMGGLGTIVGALGPIALGIGALASLLGSTKGETRIGGQFGVAFGGAVTNNRRGETYTYQGQQYDRDFSGGERRGLVDGEAYRLEGDPVAQESAIRQAVSGTAKGIDAFLEGLGSSVRLSAFSAGLETSSKDRGGVFSGGTLSDGTRFGESGEGDNYAGTLFEKFSSNSPDFKQALEDFSLDLKQSTVQALQSVSDIPESIKRQLKEVDAESLTADAADALLTSINAQIVGVAQFRAALGAMGLDQLAGMSFDAAAAIAEAAGGFEALQSSLAGFYDNYYTEAEKAALQTKQVEEALAEVGLEMPKTRAEFRAMVQANLALGESGAEAVAALLGVQDEFDAIAESVVSISDAFQLSGDTIKGILDNALDNAGSAAEASQMASAAFVESMYSSLQDAMTTNLSGLIMGAIQPMVDALIAGATTGGAAMATGGAAGGGAVAAGGAAGGGAVAAGGATAGAVMAGVLEQAKAQISAWATILADPEIQAMIGDIGSMIGGVAGVAYTAQGAWNGGGSGFVSQGSSFAGGAQSYQDALKGIGETLEEEVKRLRGLMVTDSDQSRAVLEAQFATATAAARAGDQTALAQLPSISKQLEKATEDSATSAVEVARMRGWLAGSITQTMKLLGLEVPKFDVGTNYVPRDMLAMIHEGEAIVPKAFNPAAGGVVDMAASFAPARSSFVGDYGAELVSEMRGVRRELSALREQGNSNTLAVQRLNLRSVKTLERVENILAMQK